MIKLIYSDCIIALKKLPANSVDSVVTDPPYGLGFMGKQWDEFDKKQFGKAGFEGKNDIKVKKSFNILPRYYDPTVNKGSFKVGTGTHPRGYVAIDKSVFQKFCYDWATEVFRVLKPGGYILSFGGTRTYHRMACAIEDAGFEIRDMVEWIYGSGFPKSLDIGKAIDKAGGEFREFNAFQIYLMNAIKKCGKTNKEIAKYIGVSTTMISQHYLSKSQPMLPTREAYLKLKEILTLDDREYDAVYKKEAERQTIGYSKGVAIAMDNNELGGGYRGGVGVKQVGVEVPITIPATDNAKLWDGWGTALKPAHEPIVLARKPLSEKTVANNVLKHRTGGINIDKSRVGGIDTRQKTGGAIEGSGRGTKSGAIAGSKLGRFPANLIHDGSEEVVNIFPNTKGGNFPPKRGNSQIFGDSYGGNQFSRKMDDAGSAARFFYCAKANKKERDMGLMGCEEKYKDITRKPGSPGGSNAINRGAEKPHLNFHPTVKPITLMKYLITLITPTGGTVLDPFMGSGSTGIAAKQLGFNFIGIEKEKDYIKIANKRIGA